MRFAAALVMTLVPAGLARADVTRCAGADADVTFAATDLTQHSGDTGWFPEGEAAQLRLTGIVTGKTTVAMGLHPTACWPDKMSVTAPGRPQTGLLDSEYGAQIHLYGQIHTSILGEAIDWSGEIKIPFVPNDLLLAGTTTFDPTLLAGSDQTSVSVSDTTSPVVVLSSGLLTDIIDIVGISGGLDINVTGQMTTVYSTSAISFANAPISTVDGAVTATAPDGGFGTSLSLPISATGVVHYEPSLIFAVNFYVRILGVSVINTTLASVTMPLSPIDRSITLDGGTVDVPLPHLQHVPATLGFATGASQQLALRNSGTAPLMLELTNPPAGVTAQSITIAPGADGTITVTAADPTMVAGALAFSTNDPNHASLSVALDAATTGQTNEPDPTPESEHAGCNAGRGAGALPIALIGLALVRRRRRN